MWFLPCFFLFTVLFVNIIFLKLIIIFYFTRDSEIYEGKEIQICNIEKNNDKNKMNALSSDVRIQWGDKILCINIFKIANVKLLMLGLLRLSQN